VEVDPVDVHEEAVHDVIGPEAVHLRGQLVGAVRQRLVDPAEADNTPSVPTHVQRDILVFLAHG